jgi:hypothetical protein
MSGKSAEPKPSKNIVVEQCGWDGCARHYCGDDSKCVQLTAYRY